MALTNVNVTITANAIVQNLGYLLAPLKAFSTDFTNEIVGKQGEKVNVLNIGESPDALTFNGTYTVQDLNAAGVDVTLANQCYTSFGIDEATLSKMAENDVTRFSKTKADALAKKIYQIVLAKITGANFTNDNVAVTTLNGLIDLGAKADDLGWGDNRAVVLSSTAYASLLKDVADASKLGSDEAIRTGVIRNLAGWDVYKSKFLPADSSGFAAIPSSLFMASRILAAGGKAAISSFDTYYHEETGIAFGHKVFAAPFNNMDVNVLELLFGVEVGKSEGIILLDEIEEEVGGD